MTLISNENKTDCLLLIYKSLIYCGCKDANKNCKYKNKGQKYHKTVGPILCFFCF